MPTGLYPRPPIIADRLRWLAPHVDGFKTSLGLRGYSGPTIVEVLRLLSRWAEWAQNAGFGLSDIETALATSATVFRGGKTARAPQGAAKLFVAHLRVVGILPAECVRSPEETWLMLAAYRRWMREQRGVAASTLDLHRGVLVDLVENSVTIPRPIPPRRYATSCSNARVRTAVVAPRRSRPRPVRSCGS